MTELTELNANDNESGEYKIEAICNNVVYTRELESSYFLTLYHLVFGKSFLEEENTWQLALVVQYLSKFISLFFKNYFNRLTTILKCIDTTFLMAKQIIMLVAKSITLKQKKGKLPNNINI